MIGALLCSSLGLGLAACGADDPQPVSTAAPEAELPVAATLELPADGQAFLRELAALPEPENDQAGVGVALRYRLTGPAGSGGELEVEVAPGGLRKESWRLRLPAIGDAGPREIVSSRVQNHEWVWSAVDGKAGQRYPSPLAEIAAAYDARDEGARETLVRTVRDWQSALAAARKEQPGERESIEGVSCLRMNMAGQALCLWEETGLPLSHKSDSFTLELESLKRSVPLPLEAFALPPEAESAERVPAPESWKSKGEAWLVELERGEPAALASVLTPGLRLPTALELDAKKD